MVVLTTVHRYNNVFCIYSRLHTPLLLYLALLQHNGSVSVFNLLNLLAAGECGKRGIHLFYRWNLTIKFYCFGLICLLSCFFLLYPNNNIFS